MHSAAAPGRRGLGGSSIETGNYLGTSRSVVRQSQRFRENESGNAMKALLGADHLAWDTKNKQGVFKGQRAHTGDMAPALLPEPAPPKIITCPYRVGDAVIYRQANGDLQQVTVAQVNTNVALGEEPYVAVRMHDGNVRDTVLERLSPVPIAGPVPEPEPEPEPTRRRGRRRDPGHHNHAQTPASHLGYASDVDTGGRRGSSHGFDRNYGSPPGSVHMPGVYGRQQTAVYGMNGSEHIGGSNRYGRQPADGSSAYDRPKHDRSSKYGRHQIDEGYSSPSWQSPSNGGAALPRRKKDGLHAAHAGSDSGGYSRTRPVGGAGDARHSRRVTGGDGHGTPSTDRQVRVLFTTGHDWA